MEIASSVKSSRSSLAHLHKRLGATLAVWNNMLVPERYSSNVDAEHFAIRTKAGLTDMSGIHKVFLSGKEGFEFLNHMVTRDCSKVSPGKAVYTALLDNSGRVIDDAIVVNLCKQARISFKAEWLICLGAGRGLQYIQGHTKSRNLDIHDESLACLLVQGPKALDILCRSFPDQE